jgi:hypothetical protein
MADQPRTSIEEFIRKVNKGEENAVDLAQKIRQDGSEQITVALQNRQLQPEPPRPPLRAESPRRCHTFHDVETFAAYLAKYKTQDTVVLADVPSLLILATLDEKAEDGFETIALRPAIHPLFEPWQELLERAKDEEGEPLTVEAFAEFVMTNRRAVVAPDARELVMVLSQIKASKKITIDRGRGMKSINGVVIEVSIQGQLKSEIVDLPDSLTLAVPLFIRTDPQQIEIDLLAVAGATEVYMRAVSADVEQAKVAAFEQMLAECRAIEGVVVGTGHPQTAAWDYLK